MGCIDSDKSNPVYLVGHIVKVRLKLSKSNGVGVEYGFMLGLKELLLLKSISQFTKKKRKRKQVYARFDLDLDDS